MRFVGKPGQGTLVAGRQSPLMSCEIPLQSHATKGGKQKYANGQREILHIHFSGRGKTQDPFASLKRQNQFLRANSDEYKQEDFFYASPAMRAIMSLVVKSADSDAAVLITGETGTGKDYLAHCIHQMSPRREQLFIKVNCPALVSSLF